MPELNESYTSNDENAERTIHTNDFVESLINYLRTQMPKPIAVGLFKAVSVS